MAQQIRPGDEVLSAGLMVTEHAPTKQAVAVCARHGIDIRGHVPRQLTASLAEEADLILTMTASHADAIRRFVPQAADKVHPLLAYALGEERDVTDPYGGDEAVYEACFAQLAAAIAAFYDKGRDA